MPHKIGDVVRIYDDPLTEKKFEAEAKLINMILEDDDREYWLVEFTPDHERHPRWIKKKSEHEKATEMFKKALYEVGGLCSVLEGFIKDEERGILEYDSFVLSTKLTPEHLRIFYHIVEEQRSHVEMLKRIKQEMCPS